jgi:SAM-dependent methyltransferase
MDRRLQSIQHFLRETHLLPLVERFRYFYKVLRFQKSNQEFIAKHPGFVLPPKHLAFDAYSAPHWEFYYNSGIEAARYFANLLNEHGYADEPVRILEWGCGPGRIVRHLPDLLGEHAEVVGSDYNPESVAWAQKSIANVRFVKNDLHPPLAFTSGTFDFAYAFSVFTHLSEESCLKWIGEIRRVLKENGLFFFTTHGDRSSQFLLPHEQRAYAQEGFYNRGKVREGTKMFMSLHSPDYVRSTLLKGFDCLAHFPSGTLSLTHLQDGWLARKEPA